MAGKQLATWISAAACSVALVVAGGFFIGGVAIHRYINGTGEDLVHSGFAELEGDDDGTPTPLVTPELTSTVAAITSLPAVASVALTSPTQLYVTMAPGASSGQLADVVDTTARLVTDDQVSLKLRVPQALDHGGELADFSRFFDATVSEASIQQLAQALETLAEVPDVEDVTIDVPPSWRYADSKLTLTMSGDASQAVTQALSSTALAGVSWQTAN